VELVFEPLPQDEGSWVGRIIVGRIKTILPGLFAFIDIGDKKNAFTNLKAGHGLKAGQAVLVQVQKDALGTKGMYVNLETSIKGRLVVLVGDSRAVGISRKIEDKKEALRLKKLVRRSLPADCGAIIRTNAVGACDTEISEEIQRLSGIYAALISRAQFVRPPAVLYPKTRDYSILADLLTEDMEIHIRENEVENEIRQKICELVPTLASKIFSTPVCLDKKIQNALAKRVPLPCGGWIVIEQTEACVVIDVNTGSNVGKLNYAQMILDTNLEAAAEIALQLRIRNLSGIIIIDFISMQSKHDQETLLDTFRTELEKDRIRCEYLSFIGLGMVQLSRRRIRPPLGEVVAAGYLEI